MAPATATPPRTTSRPPFGGLASLRRFSVREYHEMIAKGMLTESDPVELLEGLLVLKMSRSLAHDFAITALERRLHRIVPDPYVVRGQCAATFSDSEPEPDFIVARGPEADYRTRHPGPSDTLLVVEVSASSLERDRTDKGRIYARGGIPIYWIVNVGDRKVEVYSDPVGGVAAEYRSQVDFSTSESVPLVLDGREIGTISVAELMN
jgi:Uma2 family endonuclease